MKTRNTMDNRTYFKHEVEWGEPSRSIMIREQSFALYNRLRLKGFFHRFFKNLLRKPCELFPLTAFVQEGTPVNMVEIGVHAIPLRLVIGSENRCQDYDDNFAPKSERNHQRWLCISDLFLRGDHVPAVELVQLGIYYFVRDGHHRVSVAKALGMEFIDAKVVVLQMKEKAFQTAMIKTQHLALNLIEGK